MSTLSHGASCAHPADSAQSGQSASTALEVRTAFEVRTAHGGPSARWGHRAQEGRMAGRSDRGWWVAADLGCLAAGGAAMLFVAVRFDIPDRLFSSSSDATRLQQPMLLLGFLALALVLFGYRRYRELTARADAARWANRDALTGLPDRVVFHERLRAAVDRQAL